jgi:adenylate cyclase
MGKEIEKKFLLVDGASIPIPAKYERFKIKQGYLLAEKGKQIRVRLTKTKAVITIKYTANVVRDEYEYEIPMKDGKEIYQKCELKLEKERLSFSRGNIHFDVDSFINGIQFVEVEFKTLKDMEKWVKPQWLGQEITNNKKYSNIILAKEFSK